MDEFTEVKESSWGGRIKNALSGVAMGIALTIGCTHWLFSNEGDYLDRKDTLQEGKKTVVSVPCEQANPTNDGKLIYIACKATTNDIVEDTLFGVKENALRVKRTVQMYQWKEESQSSGSSNTTTYKYTKEWSEYPINSSYFKHEENHQNPPMPYSSQTFTAPNIAMGSFKLTENFTNQIYGFTDYPLTETNFMAMDDQRKASFKLDNGGYFSGNGNPQAPEIGALRVRFSVVKPGDLSVVGKQNNGFIESYYTKKGHIELVNSGLVGVDAMFTRALQQNAVMAWLIRLGCLLGLWLGLYLIVSPLQAIISFIPVVGEIVGVALGTITGIIALVVSIVTIALAWIVYFPLIGIAFLSAALFVLMGGVGYIRKVKVGGGRRNVTLSNQGYVKAAATLSTPTAPTAPEPTIEPNRKSSTDANQW